jgi:DNA-binding response OmpR family regulator
MLGDVSSEPNITALLVEDDVRLAKLTAEYLQSHGVLVAHATTGPQGLQEALKTRYDVVVPIIVLTARGEEADRVLGLETGADDYLAKPFSSRELLARISAVVRRARGRVGPPLRVVRAGELVVDPGSHRVTLSGREIPLTGYEFSLLRVLAERAGRVLSREQLMELATGTSEESFDRAIDVHISRIRQKLGDDPKHPRVLKTIRGVGYLLATEPSE